MGRKYSLSIHQTSIYRFCILLIWLVTAQQVLAIPKPIADILRTFEGKNKPIKQSKKVVPGGKNTPDSSLHLDETKSLALESNKNIKTLDTVPILSNVQKARLAIDEAIKDSTLVGHPATWYYRGVIYDRLLRDHISSEEAPVLLDEALVSYTQAKKLALPKTQFYSFSVRNLAALWSYFLNRGIGYYRQESVDQSLEQFTICQRILPEEPTPLLYSAIVYHGSDKPEKALASYKAYIKLQGPQFAVFRAMASIYYHKLKIFDQAIAILDEALLKFPFNNDLLEEKCLIYQAAGRIDDYMTMLAVALQNKKAHGYYEYAYVLEHQGRTKEAIDYYEQFLKNCPGQYNALRQMGFLFYNEAIKLYAQILKLIGANHQLDNSSLADSFRLIHVTVTPSLISSRLWRTDSILLSLSPLEQHLLVNQPLFSITLKWIVYDHPLVKNKQVKYLPCLLQTGKVFYTSPLYGYIYQRTAAMLARFKWMQAMLVLEQYLKKSLLYLKKAYKQDKKDKMVAQALYYSYCHLKKYRLADRVLKAMQQQKLYLEDDPFLENQPKEVF